MRFLLSYFCINSHNSSLSKTHPIEILPVLICKWKIHHLSGLHSIYYPTHLLPHFSIELVRLSLPLTDLSFPPCRDLAAHVLVPEMLVHHHLNKLDSSKVWAVPPLRNGTAIAGLFSILGKSLYPEGFIKVQNQEHLCSS